MERRFRFHETVNQWGRWVGPIFSAYSPMGLRARIQQGGVSPNRPAPFVNVAVDVGKYILYERNVAISVENSLKAVRPRLGPLTRFKLKRIGLEATGRYERALLEAAIERNLPSLVVNPLNGHRYAGAIGQLAGRRPLIERRTLALNRIKVMPKALTRSYKALIRALDKALEWLDAQLDRAV
ncbi:MAG: hypothetical protein GKR94_23160 [Gammaproteobacteria bacterium]|nr:hypothetical protein [Gammaproteobacteria bacterium]